MPYTPSLIQTILSVPELRRFLLPQQLADYTAGEELHLALKYFIRFLKIYNHYILFYKFVNSFVEFVEHGGVALFNCMNNAMVKMVF